jgi:hypothetical protein
MSGEPSQQGCVGDADLAPEVHNRELARAEEPSKGLWAHPQPPLCLSEGNQLRRRGELQGEFLLPRGRVGPRTWALRRGSHDQGVTSQERDVRRRGPRRPTEPRRLG